MRLAPTDVAMMSARVAVRGVSVINFAASDVDRTEYSLERHRRREEDHAECRRPEQAEDVGFQSD